MNRKLKIIAGVVICVAAALCGVGLVASALRQGATAPQPPPFVAAAPTPGCVHGTLPSGACVNAAPPPPVTMAAPTATAVAAPPAVATIVDGMWTIGEDAPAGTYKVVAAGDTCYWAILKSGTNGSDIVDNHLGGGNLRVTLKAGQDFETKRCGTWVRQ